ncbi:N-acetylmuramidase domain-containing protein [Phenylobacterium sp.]|uniref:N-acetylmuramidase domain-containing protein n=1 Tax=Phenylobacterium sp. TaxID=1871053 RepID=UPI0025E2FCAC|nr:N-acetylmuramidase domain-containing protein [Phenylobacterium sp.]
MPAIPSFKGEAKPFSEGAVAAAAAKLACEVAAVRAVMQVESRGGFLPDGRPRILFERHYFSRLVNGAYDHEHPDICSTRSGGYVGGAAEYDRLVRAARLDLRAAIRSASWGAFQVMGDHYKRLGYATPEAFVQGMCESEDRHLEAFVAFVKFNRLDDELRRHDWAGFARGYNGAGYKANRYDEKLAAAYHMFNLGEARADGGRPNLRMGDDGPDVVTLQRALGLNPDGDFGPATKASVIKFQKSKGLVADGFVGPLTWRTLGL